MTSLLILLSCCLLAEGDVWDLILKRERPWLGHELVGMGDLDGDGAGDFLISSPWEAPVERGRHLGVVRAISGASGDVLFGHSEPGGFGEAVVRLGDINGDGKSDFAASVRGEEGCFGFFVCSGADGSVLYSVTADVPGRRGSCQIAAVPDVDADGVQDIAVGWPNALSFDGLERGPSAVELRSGATGTVLLTVESSALFTEPQPYLGRQIGSHVWGWPDLTGDGAGEFAFSCDLGLEEDSRVEILVADGATGEVLFEFSPRPIAEGGHGVAWGGRELALALVPDSDGDGLRDLALSYYQFSGYKDGRAISPGEVLICSSKSGEVLSSIVDAEGAPGFGRALAGGGDFNGDGVPDLVVTQKEDWGWELPGELSVMSGKDGSLLRKYSGWTADGLGASVAMLDDLDDDGVPDYAVGAYTSRHQSNEGTVYVYSGRSGALLHVLGGYETRTHHCPVVPDW